ncbi:RagB/SusD family nutrient uptake outer membrane protein [Fulvivirgaceae bacterium BMA10]|uniref:RagB/SusD family nutrient uptake outer membrane protein n=1 Tax=Splendidivirga corallicola TaxID=3051826 RepID=A0ABT8KZS9_9BACT|nr:RagB/SusD family nutrient uptake outer membrane protein [Fulvivirgaceae bacterium BMA10]
MKYFNRYKYFSVVALLFLSVTACDDFLEEDNLSSLTDKNAFTGPEAFDQLVAASYNALRDVTRIYVLDGIGTDLYTRGGIIAGQDELNDYVNLTPSNGTVADYWNRYYHLIKATNTAITRADEIPDIDAADKSRGLAEMLVLRAYAYFNLVQQFGGVPLVLNEIRSAVTDFSRSDEAAVYTQIINDLEAAVNDLPTNASQQGRITKGAAQHLLAKVYLARGYQSFGSANDFTEAAQLAEAVIAGPYSLVSNYTDLVDVNNQPNAEEIFAVQYNGNVIESDGGNNRHQLLKFGYDVYPGMDRSNIYGRAGGGLTPTEYVFTLYDENDSRDDAIFLRVLFAVADKDGFNKGDTTIFFPKTVWTDAEKAAKPYVVFNPDEQFVPDGTSQQHFPLFFKFDDQAAPYGDNQGGRDAILFRLGETYLIAAEAYFKAGDAVKSAEMLTIIRQRAAKSGFENEFIVDPADVDIDFILDESARELIGESARWMDLKRTGKLEERLYLHNRHAQLNMAFDASIHLLRPIPQNEIDRSQRTLTQNTGY